MNNLDTDFLKLQLKWRDEKIAELEKVNAELNHQLKIAVSKYIDADQECNALRRECAQRQ